MHAATLGANIVCVSTDQGSITMRDMNTARDPKQFARIVKRVTDQLITAEMNGFTAFEVTEAALIANQEHRVKLAAHREYTRPTRDDYPVITAADRIGVPKVER